MKQFAKLNAVLGLDALESVDEAVSMNEEQLELVESALLQNDQAVADARSEAETQRDVANVSLVTANNSLAIAVAAVANDSEYDISTMNPANCQFDLDCDPSRALKVVPDWGSNLNLFSVGQERNFNFATKIVEPCDCFINEFFNKPQEINKVMITDLVDQFCHYYKNHPTKQVIYFRDKYGDHRQPNVKNSLS